MKKSIVLFGCILMVTLALVGCGSNGDQTNQSNNDSQESTSTAASKINDSTEPITDPVTEPKTEAVKTEPAESTPKESISTSEVTPDTDSPYDYSNIEAYRNGLQSGGSLMDSTMEFLKYYGVVVMKLGDNDDIESTFSFALSTMLNGTEQELLSVLKTAYENYGKTNGDPNLLPYMANCINSYERLHNIVYNPTGTYAEFTASYDEAFDVFVYDYDEMTDYLYSIGFFPEE